MAATAQLIMYSGSLNPSKALTKDESSAISTAVKRALSEGPVLAEPPLSWAASSSNGTRKIRHFPKLSSLETAS